MEQKNEYNRLIMEFKTKHGLESKDENIAVTIHLMNQHRIDVQAAMDQSSRGADDEGIDGWYFDEKSGDLFIYQSKLSTSKGYVLQGFSDLLSAKNWLESVLIKGEVEKIPKNTGLYSLYIALSQKKDEIKKISFILVSLKNENLLEDEREYDDCRRELIESELNKFMLEKNGKIDLRLMEYNFDSSLPITIKKYPVIIIEKSMIILGKSSSLNLAYIPLHNLVELYRQRGDILFDKNIRLSIANTKEAKERLVHPMENTFDMICEGKLDPNIFPFYHVGVTIAATTNVIENESFLLESPSIINGCQTIVIAESYLTKLEEDKKYEEISKFKEIKVIAKIVVGTTDEQLREITNANNRQNPIDNWQLFSNDPIHIEIEAELKNFGIFYERQKGKFNTVMRHADIARNYPFTNNTFVNVFDLGQIICLSRRNLQWEAKPSEIFLNKKNHDSVFDRTIPDHARDIILVSNLFRAIKRGLNNYLEKPAHSNDNTQKIFKKPLVRAYVYYLALIHFYQAKDKLSLRKDFSIYLNKIAPPTLVDEFETFFYRVVTKTKNWYMEESKNFKYDVSNKKLDEFLERISVELGVDMKGLAPFTENAIDWSKYEDEN